MTRELYVLQADGRLQIKEIVHKMSCYIVVIPEYEICCQCPSSLLFLLVKLMLPRINL